MNNLKKRKLSRKEYLQLAWFRGILDWKLYDYQQELYETISNTNQLKTVLNISRRYGKTTVLLLYSLVFALKHPNSLIRFASPTQKSLRKIVNPIMRMLLDDCPKELRPKWSTIDSCYKFRNHSEIHLAGVNSGHADDLRGQKCDLGVIDEAGDVDDLNYLYRSILLPQCLTCNGRIVIASTPPKFIGHDFELMCQEAKLEGNYLERTIYDNTKIAPDIIAEYAKESGGVDSITFRREYMCKFETEKELLIIPEYKESRHVKEFPKDAYFNHYYKFVSMDLGVKRHFTAVLFGYYDFRAAKLVIQDEFKMRGEITSQDIVKEIKAKELELWGSLPVRQRISDSDNPLFTNDLQYLHGLNVISTSKDTLEAMVNETRIFVGNDKLVVHPKCKYLQACLEGGRWKDKRIRQEFAESKLLGHMDGLASLIYMIRNLDYGNSVPHLLNLSGENHWISEKEQFRVTKNAEELSKMLGPKAA